MSDSIPTTQTAEPEPFTRIQPRIREELWLRVKSHAALNKTTAEDITEKALEAYLEARNAA